MKKRIGLVGVLAVLALLAAFMQSPLASLAPGLPGLEMFDDILVLLLVLACLPRLGKAPGMPVALIALWGVLMGLAWMQSTVEPSATFVLFRQVTIPALLILAGLALTTVQWDKIRRVAIWIGIINVAYMCLELGGVYLLDPTMLATFNEGRGEVRNGLPSYYYYWTGAGSPLSLTGAPYILRLGGTVLNPPIAGLVMAAAFVFLWRDRDFRARKFWLFALGAATLMTFSRGGWLVVLLALVLPFLMRKAGRIAAVALTLPALVYFGTQFADHGNSGVHAEGLTEGVRLGLTGPVGVGFGSVGNYLKSLNITKVSESLLGIAFSAAGIGAILIVVILVWKLWNIVGRHPHIWEAAMGLGIVSAALFSETAGGLNGTIPLWLAVGVALRKAHTAQTKKVVRAVPRPLLSGQGGSAKRTVVGGRAGVL